VWRQWWLDPLGAASGLFLIVLAGVLFFGMGYFPQQLSQPLNQQVFCIGFTVNYIFGTSCAGYGFTLANALEVSLLVFGFIFLLMGSRQQTEVVVVRQ
jgi:hypothetical protein